MILASKLSLLRPIHLISRSIVNYATNNDPRRGDRVIVGMSGGVDSSVTALILAKGDYDLSAVYMRNWDTRDESGTDRGCEWEKDWEDVRLVCTKIGIPCKLIDLSKEYWSKVFEPALHQWESGITPNPDVWCNKEIKFGALLDKVLSTTSENTWFATGHYASKVWDRSSSISSPRPTLVRPIDRKKDQTYFLSAISESALRRALFPLANFTKTEVRALAKENGLATAERPDSVGICFVGQKAKFHQFLADYIPPKPGPIVHKLTGRTVGEHSGLWQYTIGQSLRRSGLPERLFVSSKDIDSNMIYVVPGHAHESLMTRFVHVRDFNWIWADAPSHGVDSPEGARLLFVPRYRTEPASCAVRRSDNLNNLVIECDEPQHAITPGQVAVLYDGDWCLGSGVIASAW